MSNPILCDRCGDYAGSYKLPSFPFFDEQNGGKKTSRDLDICSRCWNDYENYLCKLKTMYRLKPTDNGYAGVSDVLSLLKGERKG